MIGMNRVPRSPFVGVSPTATLENTSISPKQGKLKDAVRNKWKQISYSILQQMSFDNLEINSWVCTPQIVSNLMFLAKCAGTLPSRVLLKEMQIIDDGKVEFNPTIQTTANRILSDELARWEQYLEEFAAPANYWTARRLLVSSNYTKSYSLQTYIGLKYFKVEVFIVPEIGAHSSIADWIRHDLHSPALNANLSNTPGEDCRKLIQLWKPQDGEGIETGKVKRKRRGKNKRIHEKEEMTAINQLKESNEKCPILAWISHYQIVFRPKLLDTQKLYYNQLKWLFFRLSDANPKIKYAKSERLEVYELPCLQSSQVVYILRGISRVEEFLSLEEMMTMTKEGACNLKTVYIPIWKAPETATNMAKLIKGTIDNDLLFAPNGFGDLSVDDGEPSVDDNSNLSSNIQHFNVVSVKHEPEGYTATEIHEGKSDSCHIIDIPFNVIIWDRIEEMPVYMGRINQPTTVGSNTPEDEEKSGPATKKCVIL